MKYVHKYLKLIPAFCFLITVVMAGQALAQQPKTAIVGIDPEKNLVRLPNTVNDPLAVKVIGSGSARRPYQARAIVQPLANGFQTVFLPIPAGKRLVIENVSAISRCADGQVMEVNFFTYMDNDQDGEGGIEDITFHRIAFDDRIVIDGIAISTMNHRVLIFAEELIGTSHYQIGVQARLNATAIGTPQAQLTFSGYLEDLSPVVP